MECIAKGNGTLIGIPTETGHQTVPIERQNDGERVCDRRTRPPLTLSRRRKRREWTFSHLFMIIHQASQNEPSRLFIVFSNTDLRQKTTSSKKWKVFFHIGSMTGYRPCLLRKRNQPTVERNSVYNRTVDDSPIKGPGDQHKKRNKDRQVLVREASAFLPLSVDSFTVYDRARAHSSHSQRNKLSRPAAHLVSVAFSPIRTSIFLSLSPKSTYPFKGWFYHPEFSFSLFLVVLNFPFLFSLSVVLFAWSSFSNTAGPVSRSSRTQLVSLVGNFSWSCVTGAVLKNQTSFPSSKLEDINGRKFDSVSSNRWNGCLSSNPFNEYRFSKEGPLRKFPEKKKVEVGTIADTPENKFWFNLLVFFLFV